MRLLLILGMFALAAPALAEPLPLGTVIAAAEARFAGQVIGADLVEGRREERTPQVFALRLLTPQGAVLNLRFDAQSGAFLDAEGRGIAAARRQAGGRP
jgi:hypothetical protein